MIDYPFIITPGIEAGEPFFDVLFPNGELRRYSSAAAVAGVIREHLTIVEAGLR